MAEATSKLARIGRSLQLATLADAVDAPTAYLYELKYDGYRIAAVKSRGGVRLVTRRGQDWTGDFPSVARDVAGLPASSFVLDGEVCAPDEHGVPSFQRLPASTALDHPRDTSGSMSPLVQREDERADGLPRPEVRPIAHDGELLASHALDLEPVSRAPIRVRGAPFFEESTPMKALCWHGHSDVRIDTVPDPKNEVDVMGAFMNRG